MTDLARYAGSAWGGRTENGALRWDRNLSTRGVVARERAMEAAAAMGEMVARIENDLGGYTPLDAAKVRESWAPLYYDFHRATRVAAASDLDVDALTAQHIATLRLAKFIATQRPKMLNPATADLAVRDGTTDLDFAREYMLFTHSIVPKSLDTWPDNVMNPGLARHLTPRAWLLDAEQRLDRSLRTRLGALTRSPKMALVASASALPTSLLRGFVVRPTGDMVFAEVGDPVSDETEATYLFVMSLGMRHLAPMQQAFDEGLRERGTGNRDKSLHVSSASILAGEHLASSPHDGRTGHYPAEMARSLVAQSAFPHGPTQESADHARSLFYGA